MLSTPINKCLLRLLVVLPAAWAAVPARADIIRWEIQGSFVDQGVLQGRFDFDPASASFSNVLLTTTPGAAGAAQMTGWRYDQPRVLYPQTDVNFPFGLRIYDAGTSGAASSGHHDLYLSSFDPRAARATPLDIAEFTRVTLAGQAEAVLQERFGMALASPTAVSITSPIPEPETYALLLAGLGLCGVLRRRALRGAAARPQGSAWDEPRQQQATHACLRPARHSAGMAS